MAPPATSGASSWCERGPCTESSVKPSETSVRLTSAAPYPPRASACPTHRTSCDTVEPPVTMYQLASPSRVTVRSASTPPRALHSGVYVTAPSGRASMSLPHSHCIASSARGPCRWSLPK
eukprot:6610692-Prymnesium_polylepis.1